MARACVMARAKCGALRGTTTTSPASATRATPSTVTSSLPLTTIHEHHHDNEEVWIVMMLVDRRARRDVVLHEAHFGRLAEMPDPARQRLAPLHRLPFKNRRESGE